MRTNFASFTLALLGAKAIAEPSMFELVTDAQNEQLKGAPLRTNVTTNGFGHNVYEQIYADNVTEKTISQPELPYFLDH